MNNNLKKKENLGPGVSRTLNTENLCQHVKESFDYTQNY